MLCQLVSVCDESLVIEEVVVPVTVKELAQQYLLPVHWWIASKMPISARRQYLHTVGVRRHGNFRRPVTMNEKVNWRILNDRRHVIVRVCDKLEMKDLARETVPDANELRIPETLWFGPDLREAPDLSSLGPWVLKPNHSSGSVILGPTDESRADLEARTAMWVKSKPGEMLGEWGYTRARPVLLLEERIPTPGACPPDDYKFFVFDGVPRMVQVNSGRGRSLRASFYDPNWRRLPVKWWSTPSADEPRPETLDKMLDLAARLGQGWDFIRIDLYSVADRVWFGEFSPYPGGGLSLWTPDSFDFELGSLWTLPVDRSSDAHQKERKPLDAILTR